MVPLDFCFYILSSTVQLSSRKKKERISWYSNEEEIKKKENFYVFIHSLQYTLVLYSILSTLFTLLNGFTHHLLIYAILSDYSISIFLFIYFKNELCHYALMKQVL